MRSWLGAILAALYALAFGAAYFAYAYAGSDWTAMQWLFFVALPYTLTMVRAFGSVDFSGESIVSLVQAAAFCCAISYLAGALVEAILRLGFLGARRLIRGA